MDVGRRGGITEAPSGDDSEVNLTTLMPLLPDFYATLAEYKYLALLLLHRLHEVQTDLSTTIRVESGTLGSDTLEIAAYIVCHDALPKFIRILNVAA
jgi:hypothetical protein